MDLRCNCQMNGSNKAYRPGEDAGATDPSVWLRVRTRPHKQQHRARDKYQYLSMYMHAP